MENKVLKVIIAGSRKINDYNFLLHIMNCLTQLYVEFTFHIISGGARGVDQNAKEFAMKNKLKYTEYKPEYKDLNDKEAPLRRNVEMSKIGDLLIAIHDGQSKGTLHMISQMKKLNKPYYVHKI